MIVETADKERSFDTDLDFFSIAGRTALIGGGIYAIDKTSFGRNPHSPFSQRSNKLKTTLAEMVSRNANNATSELRKNFGTFKSKYAIGGLNIDRSIPAGEGGIEDVISKLTGGYNGRSKQLPDELRRLNNLIGQRFGQANIFYEMHNNEISKINFKAGSRNFPINVVSSMGQTRLGRAQQSSYASRGLYRHTNAGTEFFGEDVGLTRAYINNLDKIDKGELSVHQLRQAYDRVRYYDEDSTRFISGTANPDAVNMVVKSYAEDPGLSFTGDQMTGRKKREFLTEMSQQNRAVSSPADIARGFIHDLDSPIHMKPNLIDTPDPKKIIRDVQYKGVDGSTSFLANKRTLFMEAGLLEKFKEVAANKGINIGELAPDQLLVSGENNGTLISRLRRMSVAETAMSEASESILDKLAGLSGKKPGEVAEILSEKGLSGFSQDIQDQMRKVRLGDYESGLKGQRDRIVEGYEKAIREAGQKDPSALGTIKSNYAKELSEIDQKLEGSRFFGKKADYIRDSIIKPGMEDLFIDDIALEDGQYVFSMRRESLLGVGDKLHTSSGEGKAIVKARIDGMAELLEEAYTANGGVVTPEMRKIFGEVNMIATGDALKDGITDRTANALLYAAKEKAKREGNTKLLEELTDFHNNYHSLDDKAQRDIFGRVKDLTGLSLDKYVNQSTAGLGVIKDLEAAFGYSAVDMGSGGLGSFSRRHLENFQSLGLKSFVEETLSNRTNPEIVQAAVEFEKLQSLIKDKKFAGTIKLSDMTRDDIEELFPNVENENIDDIINRRASILKKYGVEGNAIIDLGQEISGQSKVAVLNHKNFYGISGAKIGASNTDYRAYSEYDASVRQVLIEGKSKFSDEKKLAIAMKNHQTAIQMTKGTLSDNFLKGKVKNSMYGLVDSAPEGLEEYSKAVQKYYGTKAGLPSLGVVSDEDYVRMFGQDKLNSIQDMIKKNGGPFGRGSVIGVNNFIKPNSFAMITREPVEGLSHIAMGVLPSSMFKGNVAKGHFSVIRQNNKDGWSLMDLLFGDSDGDHLAILSSRSTAASAELEKLAFGNDDLSVAFREAQAMKGELQLKGKNKYGTNPDGSPVGMLDVDTQKRRQAQLLQKLSEKTNIGKISKGLESGHTAARTFAIHSSSIDDMKKFFNVENTLHFIAEFTLKAKHQNVDDLVADKAVNLLENITGQGSAKLMEAEQRKANVLRAMDEMMLGEGGHDIANRVRSGDLAEDVMRTLNNAGVSPDASYFRHIGTMDNISRTVDMVGQGQTMGNTVSDIMKYASEGVDSTVFKSKHRLEKITDTVEYVKDLSFKGGKNLLKYALLPAAGIGLLGTLVGSKSEIRSDGEKQYTDGQKHHYSRGHSPKPIIQPQVKRPKYENIKIRGESNGAMFNPNEVPANSNIRMEDHRSTLDKYQIQEIVERGI